MAWSGRQETQIESVTAAIRSDIVTGRLAAGSEIQLAELSEQLDVPMTTARDALVRLADQHLVAVSPEQEFRVVSVSQHELEELTRLRQLVEGAAVRLAVEHGDGDWAQRVREAFSGLAAAEEAAADHPSLRDEWRLAHTAFHESLCDGAGNGRLVSLASTLRDEAEIYRELSDAAIDDARRQVVSGEHRRLMQLAVDGRADEASALLREHLEGTMRSVIRSRWPEAE